MVVTTWQAYPPQPTLDQQHPSLCFVDISSFEFAISSFLFDFIII